MCYYTQFMDEKIKAQGHIASKKHYWNMSSTYLALNSMLLHTILNYFSFKKKKINHNQGQRKITCNSIFLTKTFLYSYYQMSEYMRVLLISTEMC